MSDNGTKEQVDLQKLLSGAQLPALPQSAIRLLELSQDPDNGPSEFSVPIEADPGLTGQVLRFVNSSYFGFSREISSVKMAITLVGIRTIKNFALWSAVFSLMPNPKCGPFDLKVLWQDSLRRGLFARAMGKLMKMNEAEDLFAAGLLQDMAVPLLAKDMPDEYAELIEQRDNGKVRLSKLEKDRFGWTHGEAAGVLARHWKLPQEFSKYIERHTDAEELIQEVDSSPPQLAIALSALLPSASDEFWHEHELFTTIFEKMAGSTDQILELLETTDTDMVEFAPVLKVATPAKTFAEYFQEVAAAKS